MSKIEKGKDIVTFMIEYYCIKNHNKVEICKSCMDLIEYAHAKLSSCPFGEKKESCIRCKIHCYSKGKREQIRKAMSYVGPRMIFLMPLQYVKHLFNKS